MYITFVATLATPLAPGNKLVNKAIAPPVPTAVYTSSQVKSLSSFFTIFCKNFSISWMPSAKPSHASNTLTKNSLMYKALE